MFIFQKKKKPMYSYLYEIKTISEVFRTSLVCIIIVFNVQNNFSCLINNKLFLMNGAKLFLYNCKCVRYIHLFNNKNLLPAHERFLFKYFIFYLFFYKCSLSNEKHEIYLMISCIYIYL